MRKNMNLDELLKDQLKDQRLASMYLEECLAEGDLGLFKKALKDVAAAQLGGMTALSQEGDLNRQALYRSLSEKGNPRLDTLTKVLDALGLRMGVVVKERAVV